MSDIGLLRAHEPVLRFTRGEHFFPSDVDSYVRQCSLWLRGPRTKPRVLVPVGALDLQRLADFVHVPPGDALFLQFVQKPISALEYQKWMLRPDRDPFTAPGRHARVPLISRIVDAGFDFSLMLRGTVPGGTAAAAEMKWREIAKRDGRRVYYGRVVRQGGWIVLHYLFFYPMNDWRSGFHGTNDHEADWEQVFVYLYEPEGGGSPVPRWVAYASHDFHGDDLRRRWDDPLVQRVGRHPVVYSGAGSHASYFEAGEYIMRVEPQFLQPVKRVTRRIREMWAETLGQGAAPKAGTPLAALLSIPFVDYARGDGAAIGPGEESEWTPILISDDTSWVDRYRGLWGLDTGDAFGGERAPAGPKYNRDGSVRRSWYDPVGWAGLDKVPPPSALVPALDARVGELHARASELTRQIDAYRSEVRQLALDEEALRTSAFLGGLHRVKARALSDAVVRLRALQAERIATGELLTANRARRARIASGDWGPPEAHLRHTHRPEPPGTGGARWLELWGAVSGGLALLAFVALLFLRPGYWWAWVVALSLALVAVEALARRRFVDLLLNIVVALAVITTLVLIWEFWRELLVLGLAGLALFIMRDNLRELMGR
ncbi:MAG TPA: hypothetical protein VFS33_01385 [Gemmatimonadales bacterium]|nr:hypothetical protein [Gemmatimonadales bacterium]